MKILVLILSMFLSFQSFAGHPDLPTVKSVEINRYLGKWFEIARFPQKFQEGCTATTAEYSVRNDRDIKVLNKCRMDSPDGELKESVGRAWVKDKKTNAKLKVQFFLKNFKFFLFAGNYWILDLDENYTSVLVGDKSRKYLWILSRSSTLNKVRYDELVNKAKTLGFDTSKLIDTIH